MWESRRISHGMSKGGFWIMTANDRGAVSKVYEISRPSGPSWVICQNKLKKSFKEAMKEYGITGLDHQLVIEAVEDLSCEKSIAAFYYDEDEGFWDTLKKYFGKFGQQIIDKYKV
jgi:hypothetical protein